MPKSLLEVENLRGYRDRDYVQTIEEYFFCVIGTVHPQDRVIAYLKYVPDPAGKWGQKNRRFRRALRYYTVMDLLETLRFLERHPEYLYDSSVMGIKISAVPKNRVSVHFKPEEKMSRLLKMKKPDVLQQKSVDLAKLISDESGVHMEYFGVTGSVLLDIHQAFSDIDLVVYGNGVEDIHEVASYEGLYEGIAEEGEEILAYGKLERVIDNKLGKEHHRILIGSREAEGRDYIKPTYLS